MENNVKDNGKKEETEESVQQKVTEIYRCVNCLNMAKNFVYLYNYLKMFAPPNNVCKSCEGAANYLNFLCEAIKKSFGDIPANFQYISPWKSNQDQHQFTLTSKKPRTKPKHISSNPLGLNNMSTIPSKNSGIVRPKLKRSLKTRPKSPPKPTPEPSPEPSPRPSPDGVSNDAAHSVASDQEQPEIFCPTITQSTIQTSIKILQHIQAMRSLQEQLKTNSTMKLTGNKKTSSLHKLCSGTNVKGQDITATVDRLSLNRTEINNKSITTKKMKKKSSTNT